MDNSSNTSTSNTLHTLHTPHTFPDYLHLPPEIQYQILGKIDSSEWPQLEATIPDLDVKLLVSNSGRSLSEIWETALEEHDVELLKLLLTHRLTVDSYLHGSALSIAVLEQDQKLVSLLVALPDLDVNGKINAFLYRSYSLVEHAIKEEQPEIATLIIEHTSYTPSYYDLMAAVEHNHPHLVYELVQYPLMYNSRDTMTDAFIESCKLGHLEVVQIFLSYRGLVNVTESDNIALRWAAYHKHYHVVERLLQDHRITPMSQLR